MAVQEALAREAKADQSGVESAGYFCGEPGCGCALGLGCGGVVAEPGCGCVEPGCGCVGPGCNCPTVVEGPVYSGDDCGECLCGDVGCGGACADCPPSLGGCAERGAIPLYIYLPPIKEIILYAGVQGFTSPLDYNPAGRDGGNFGFHEGVNIGGRMSWLPVPGLGYQIGYQGTQNQLSGDVQTGASSHSQQFFTAGLFRRQFIGWQYGFVYDLLQDERQGSNNFSQVRGLFGFTNPHGHELGFEFAAGTSTATLGGTNFQAADQYKLYWRRRGQSGGEFQAFLGGSDQSHVILGGNLYAPLNERWSIETGFTYFVPTDGGAGTVGPPLGAASGAPNATEEAWNLGINLVWHYGARGRQWYRSPWRPLFSVADNGSLLIDDVD
ncbi:MAG: DUF6666 family protein [Planctomycetota bacterium]